MKGWSVDDIPTSEVSASMQPAGLLVKFVETNGGCGSIGKSGVPHSLNPRGADCILKPVSEDPSNRSSPTST
ncbi:MAG: hypothetical protein ACO2ZN_12120, partial [Paracoccaceae bacterium]